MRNDKGYNDPTATIAIGRVYKEEKRKQRTLQYEQNRRSTSENKEHHETIEEIIKEYKTKQRYKKMRRIRNEP